MENRKTNKNVFGIVIVLIVAISFISLLYAVNIKNKSQISNDFELVNVNSESKSTQGEDVAIESSAESEMLATMSSASTEDYSEYTDQVLPENINKNNIGQYIPVDKFNSGETIVYNGRNYGFVIVCQVGTNYVLIFREVYLPHEDGDGYDIKLEVVYENNFYVTAFGLAETYNGQHLGLADIKFNNFIIDADVNNFVANKDYDASKDDGPYYIQSRYSSNFSYFNQELADEIVSFSTTALISIFAPAAGPVVKKSIDKLLDYAGTIMDVHSMSNSLAEDTWWLTDATLDTAVDFPLERQSQVETYDRLIKNLGIEMGAGSSEYITQNENSPNFAKATFRVRNENDKDYYIYNNISFRLCRFVGGASVDLGEYTIESLYQSEVSYYNGSTELIEKDGEFQIVNGDVFAPMIQTNIFNFKPEEPGYYRFIMPEGYDLMIDGTIQNDDRIFVDSDGCLVGVSQNGAVSNSSVYGKFVKDDFYNGQLDFSNIKILKDQSLDLNAINTINGMAYTVVSSGYNNNDLFIVDAGDYAVDVELYIVDENLDILSSATKVDGVLYVNYPMQPNEKYAVICVNKSGQPLDLTVNREAGITINEYPYKEIEGLYYRAEFPYSQYYSVDNAEVYRNNVIPLDAIQDNIYYLSGNQTYFLKSINTSLISFNFADVDLHKDYSFGDVIECDGTNNTVVEFTPDITALYSFADGYYDVFSEDGILKNVSQAVLYQNQQYQIVKRNTDGIFQISFDEINLQYGDNALNIQDEYKVYTYTVSEELRCNITIADNSVFGVYEEDLFPVRYDHGYLLEAGKYYIIVENSGATILNISEYLQEVQITLYVEGEIFNADSDVKYYYGKPFILPVPSSERKRFNGWGNESGLLTNALGESNGVLLADELVLEADFTWKNIIMQVNWSEIHDTKWWTGDDIVSQPESVYIEGDIIDLLVNMRYDFMQLEDSDFLGHFFEIIDYEIVSSDDECEYYIFTPRWMTEKYLISYMLNGNINESITSAPVTFGETLPAGIGLEQLFENNDNAMSYRTGLVVANIGIPLQNFYIGAVVGDLTEGDATPYNFDSDGDGIDDCCKITIFEQREEVKYWLDINDNLYEVDNDGYIIGGFESYGYDEDSYLGKFVYLSNENLLEENSNNVRKFLFNNANKVTKSELSLFWSIYNDDTTQVEVAMQLVSDNLTVNIIYPNGVTDISDDQTLITEYEGGNVALNPGYVKGYKFNYWTLNGNRIDTLNYQNLGMLKCSYKKIEEVELQYNVSRTELKPTSLMLYNITDEAVFIDCSRFLVMTGMTFKIKSSAKEITFADGVCSDTVIEVEQRTAPLNIYFEDVQITALSGQSVIDAPNCPQLTLHSFDSVTLKGGEATLSASAPAIVCRNLTLSGENFYIYGGNSYSYDYAGRAGIYCDGDLIVNAKNVKAYGGDGGQLSQRDYEEITLNGTNDYKYNEKYKSYFVGKDAETEIGVNGKNGEDGENGKPGAVAIYVEGSLIISKESTLTCEGGDGGYGEHGEDGQIGGPGRDGKFGVTSKASGSGGNGGKGGNGGDGGKAIYVKSTFNNEGTYQGIDGKGGKRGLNGYGAPPGTPGTTVFGNEKCGNQGKQPTEIKKDEYGNNMECEYQSKAGKDGGSYVY